VVFVCWMSVVVQRQTVAEILVIWNMVAMFIILCVQICGSTVLTPVCQHWLEATAAFCEKVHHLHCAW